MHSIALFITTLGCGFFMGAFVICAVGFHLEQKMDRQRIHDEFLKKFYPAEEVYDQEKDPIHTILKY